MTTCDLCGRQAENTTEHHLIPRARHKNKKNKKSFTRTEVKKRTATLCKHCHVYIHKRFTEKQLERDFNTIDLLRSDPGVRRYISWIAKKREGSTIPLSR